MKAGLALILVTLAGLQALPASAQDQDQATQPVAVSTDDLPLTDRFAALLTSYRNCVLRQVDRTTLGGQQDMAKAAMSACALSRGELRGQLVSDIQARQPQLSPALALRNADNGMAQLDPMIEAAAVDWAHMRYARTMD